MKLVLSLLALLLAVIICQPALGEEPAPRNINELLEAIQSKIQDAKPFSDIAPEKYKAYDPALTEEKLDKLLAQAKAQAKKETIEKFPKKLLKKTIRKALKEYKAFEKGDQLTVPVRYGRGFRDVSGTLDEIGANAIIVSGRRIPKVDLPKRILARLDKVESKRNAKKYVHDNFYKPRKQYYNKHFFYIETKLRERFEKNLTLLHEREKAEKRYQRKIKYTALKTYITNYFNHKLATCESSKTAKEKFAMYNQLVNDAHAVIKVFGKRANRLINKLINLNHLEYKLLPKLERKAAFENIPEDKEKKPTEPKKVYYSGLG